ncbi:M30 family zinc metallopeptidase [Cupriavidus pauculus]|uniref:M30 family zinc metallopeptidase n=1 Tax=Cupriavidus pauculus TaxID=82633 RepID=UPI001EE38670|nr:hemagglutinin [Cupriavidus pauculus]GJG97000.1 hypothetical protein CBA19C6_20945 [Cupriavidus pauculus]
MSIYEVKSQDVSLVFSNDGATAQPMPPIAMQAASPVPPPAANLHAPAQSGETSMADRIREFNQGGWVTLLEQMREQRATPHDTPPAAQNRLPWQRPDIADSRVGDTRQWYNDEDEPPRDATLLRQGTLRDGTVVNMWVETAETGENRVTDTVLDTLLHAYRMTGGIYEFVYDIGGPMWGAHTEWAVIPAANQPINLVLLNLGDDMSGYFMGANAFVSVPGTVIARSNEAVALFINTAMLYPDNPQGVPIQILTLAHESVHMQNFYRRGVKLGADYVFEDWLDEGSAVRIEDYISERLLTGYNEVRDGRVPQYLSKPHYGCSPFNWPKTRETCDGYAVWGAWGGYLNRQLGMPFYRNLLNNTTHTTSATVLDAAIRSVRPESGTVPEMRRWAATIGALVPAAKVPVGYGYPARPDADHPLPEIDLQTMVDERKLPTSAAGPLAGWSMLPIVRRGIRGTFSGTVTVPPRTTLSVVIHDGKV